MSCSPAGGGDELISFNGRGYFAELVQQRQWGLLWRESWQKACIDGPNAYRRLRIFLGIFIGRTIAPLLPDCLVPYLDPFAAMRRSKPSYLNSDFAHRMKATAPHIPQLRERAGVHRNQIMLLRNGHITTRIQDWMANAAPHHLIYRYPLLDRRLIEFSLGIPSWCFFRKGWKRYLYRTALEGILPDATRWKPTKADVSQYQGPPRWSAKAFRQSLASQLLEEGSLPEHHPYLDVSKVRQALRVWKPKPDYTSHSRRRRVSKSSHVFHAIQVMRFTQPHDVM